MTMDKINQEWRFACVYLYRYAHTVPANPFHAQFFTSFSIRMKHFSVFLVFFLVSICCIKQGFGQPAPPSVPSWIVTSPVGTEFSATWGRVVGPGPVQYRLDVSTNSAFSSFLTGYSDLLVPATSTNPTVVKIVTGLSRNTKYYYRVRVITLAGTSANSATVTAATDSGAPFLRDASNVTDVSFMATWAGPSDATGYRLDVSTQADFSSFVLGFNDRPVSTNSVMVFDLQPNTTYYYRVRGAFGLEVSGNSSSKSTTTGDMNYIRSTNVTVPGKLTAAQAESSTIQERSTTYSFFDGLGRPVQQVSQRASPQQQDIVTTTVYDAFGREYRKYLPFVQGSDGWHKSAATNAAGDYTGLADNTYGNNAGGKIVQDTRPFAETVFESSPLNRTLREYGPGIDWSPGQNDKFVSYQYLGNVHGTGSSPTEEKVIALTVNGTGAPVRIAAAQGFIETGGYYSSKQLLVTVTADEHGHMVREYKNKAGKVILQKAQVGATPTSLNSTTQWALTYYIYDDRENLRFVLQPELSRKIHAAADSYNITETDRTNLAFQYEYDARKRMAAKRIPGSEWVYMVYDNRDRLVLTQDGNQREGNYWSFIKYDATDRPVLTGIKDTTLAISQELMQQAVDKHYAKSWTRYGETFVGYETSNIHGYSNLAYPVCTSGTIVDANHYLTVTYYDGYKYQLNWYGRDYSYVSTELVHTVGTVSYRPPAAAFSRVYGQITGTKVKVLEDDIRGGYTWLKTGTYYDDRYRTIQTISDNLKGGTDRQSTLYDFTGKVLKANTSHTTADIAWTDMLGTRFIGNRLYRNITNNSWGQAGAASVELLPAGQNGWVEFTASEAATSRVLGVSPSNADANFTSISYAFYLRNDGALLVLEKNTATGQAVEKASVPGGYKPGDVLRIAREGTAIKYYRNGTEVYPAGASITQLASSTPLLVDVAFANSNGTITDVRASFALSEKNVNRRFAYDHASRLTEIYHGLGSGVAWQEHDGTQADVTGKMLTKTGTASSWDAGAASQQVIPAGIDGWLEFRGVERNTARMIGLAANNTTANYSDIDYAIYLRNNGALNIYELGQQIGVSRTYYTTDIFRVERKGNTVVYKVNDEIIYTSAVSSTTVLRAACSIYTPAATITHAYIGNGSGRSEVLVARHTYNELGQLVDKDLHSVSGTPFQQSVDYRHNIRGWLTSINDASLANDGIINDDIVDSNKDYFGMNLAYNTTDLGVGNTPLFNGNITGVVWSHNLGLGTVKRNGYTYGYDAMNRITGSVFKERTSSTWTTMINNKFAEAKFSYDLNGNIQTLTRNDDRLTGTMDILTYDYGSDNTQSNRLLKVTDAGDNSTGFIEGTNTGNDYVYDANGNLKRDLNKGIGTTLTDANNNITYNFLNLPQTVTKGENTIRYIYDATGRKLVQQVGVGPGVQKTDYIGEFIYEDDVLQYILHDEGRVVVTSPRLVYTNDFDDASDVTADQSTVETLAIDGNTYVKARMTGTARPGLFPIGGGITVKAGERYKVRARGYRLRGAAANSHAINLRMRINGADDLGWPGALIPAGATTIRTESWVEQTVTIPPGGVLLEAGVSGSVSIAVGEDIYLNAFEIIRLEDRGAEYQYYMKDHLGDVRLTFTSKPTTPETFATNFETEDDGTFLNYTNSTFDLVDHTDAGTTYQNVQKLNGGTHGRVGVAQTFPVMPGDQIKAVAYCKYMNLSSTPNANALITSLAAAFGVSAASTGDQLAAYDGLNSFSGMVVNGDHVNDNESAAKAFVTILFFDTEHNLIDAAWDQVSTTGAQNDPLVKKPHDGLSITAVAQEAGYAYVFVSNEHPTFVDVYFDDVTFTHTPSAIVAIDDYYAFGMNFNSTSRQDGLGQKYFYNGKEKQDELGIDWLDYGARMYQPEIGRFTTHDRYAEKYFDLNPYNYVANNPIANIDINGDSIKAVFYDSHGKLQKTVPSQVQSMFNKEFGIKVGYNAKTGMMYYAGEYESDLSQSSTATGLLKDKLTDTNTGYEHGEIIFGYNLRGKDGAVEGGSSQKVWQLGDGVINKNYIDLEDFTSEGRRKGWEYNGMSTRDENIARIFEHEYLGHHHLDKMGSGDGTPKTMGAVVEFTNQFRRERGDVLERLSYGARTVPYGKTSDFKSKKEMTQYIRSVANGKIKPNSYMHK